MMQVIEQTHDEKVAMYMKSCTKKQLAEMLANCNELLATEPIKKFNIEAGYISPTTTCSSILPERFY